jgi:uncharacterized integral membrane protein
MTRSEIILIVVLVGALIAVVLALSAGRPRVTEINRTVRRKKDETGDSGDA